MSDISGLIVDELRLYGSMQPDSSTLEGEMTSSYNIVGTIEAMRGPKGDKGDPGEPGASGVDSYPELKNKPQINGVTLEGNKSFQELGLDNIVLDCGSSITMYR